MTTKRSGNNNPWQFTRGERNGILALLALTFLMIILPSVWMNKYDKRQFQKQLKQDKEIMARLEAQIQESKARNKTTEPAYKNNTVSDGNAHQQAKSVIVNINTATANEWEALPGIGEVLAGRIVKYRDKLGGFYRVEQVSEVYGLPPETFDKVRPQLKCDKNKVKRLDINTVSLETLDEHPYISPTLAKQITGYRQKVKPFSHPEDIKVLYAMSDSLYNKLVPYIMVSSNP